MVGADTVMSALTALMIITSVQSAMQQLQAIEQEKLWTKLPALRRAGTVGANT